MTHQIKHPKVRSHTDMARALWAMAGTIVAKNDEEKKLAQKSLNEKANWHSHQAKFFPTYITRK